MQDNNSPDTATAAAVATTASATVATAAATVATTATAATLDDPDTLDETSDNYLFNVRRRGRSVPNTNPENRPNLSGIFRAPPAPELPQDDFLLGREGTSSTRASSSPTPVQSPRGQGRG